MKYLNRANFVNAFQQIKEKEHITVKSIARRCNLSSSYIYHLTSPQSRKKRISLLLVKEIAFGMGMDKLRTQQWIFQMGTIYHSQESDNEKRSTSNKHQPHDRYHDTHFNHYQHRRLKNVSQTKQHSHLKIILTIGILALILLLCYTGWSIYQGHETTEQQITRLSQNNKKTAYDQRSLREKTNQRLTQKLVKKVQKKDSNFAKSIVYNPQNNVATISLKNETAKLINYASTKHTKKVSPKEEKAIRLGIKIDDRLTDQAIKITNQSHNGYFTFRFKNAKQYEAPNTTSSK